MMLFFHWELGIKMKKTVKVKRQHAWFVYYLKKRIWTYESHNEKFCRKERKD